MNLKDFEVAENDSIETITEKHKRLSEFLLQLNKSYYEEESPLADDAQYDELMKYLKYMESTYGLTSQVSTKVGSSLSSTKSQTGHLLGAAGAVEAVFSILTIKNQTMPPSINIDMPIEHENIEIVSKETDKVNINYVLSNSFGFGGTNVSLIFKRLN